MGRRLERGTVRDDSGLTYLRLSCALDALAMILLTIPIFFPVARQLELDPIRFGVIAVMVVELGLITPPVGMNVFGIKGMAPDVPQSRIYSGVLPLWAPKRS